MIRICVGNKRYKSKGYKDIKYARRDAAYARKYSKRLLVIVPMFGGLWFCVAEELLPALYNGDVHVIHVGGI